MYYQTPDVTFLERFTIKYRALIITILLFVTLALLYTIKPQLISNEDFFWLQESQNLEHSQTLKQHTYVSRLSLQLTNLTPSELKKITHTLNYLKQNPHIQAIDTLFSQKNIIKEGEKDSNLIKAIDLSTLSATELKEFIGHLPKRFANYINPHGLILYFYIHSDRPIWLDAKKIAFKYHFSQPNTIATLKDYLIYICAILFSIILLFRLIFKNYFSSFIAFIIIFIALTFTAAVHLLVTGSLHIHMAMPLIIVAISLVDYLYFYYRWHVSQYKADMKRAMRKTSTATSIRHFGRP